MVVMTRKLILAPEGLFWRAKSVSEWSCFTFVYIGNAQSEIKPHLAKHFHSYASQCQTIFRGLSSQENSIGYPTPHL